MVSRSVNWATRIWTCDQGPCDVDGWVNINNNNDYLCSAVTLHNYNKGA